MKIARFSTDGDPRYGIVDGDDLVVLAGDPMFSGFGTTGERVPLDAVRLLAPVIPRSKIVCIGLNYGEHKADMHVAAPETPLMFLKPNTAIVGPGDAIQIPPVDGRIVHEGELAIVIGKIAKQVRAEDAADYIFGYTIANDVSARDVMFSDGQWARAKGYDTFCPIGPVIETELDTSNLDIQTYVDGEARRHGNTRDMIHGIGEILAFASDVWTLLPGDLILTGTPAGLGGFVDGQTVDITIEGIGTLSNPARTRVERSYPAAAPAEVAPEEDAADAPGVDDAVPAPVSADPEHAEPANDAEHVDNADHEQNHDDNGSAEAEGSSEEASTGEPESVPNDESHEADSAEPETAEPDAAQLEESEHTDNTEQSEQSEQSEQPEQSGSTESESSNPETAEPTDTAASEPSDESASEFESAPADKPAPAAFGWGWTPASVPTPAAPVSPASPSSTPGSAG